MDKNSQEKYIELQYKIMKVKDFAKQLDEEV